MSQLLWWYLLLVQNKFDRGEISLQLAFRRLKCCLNDRLSQFNFFVDKILLPFFIGGKMPSCQDSSACQRSPVVPK